MRCAFLGVILCIVCAFTLPAGAETYRLATEDYPPFCSPDMPAKGWAWEVASAALASQGVVGELEFFPWKRALLMAKLGKADGLFGAFYTKERAQHFAFSAPIAAVRVGFFRHADRDDIAFDGDLKTLRKYIIGVGAGYAVTPEFDSAEYLKKEESVDTGVALKKLYLKRLHLTAGVETVDLHRMRNDLALDYPDIAEKIVFMEPPLQTNYLHIAFSRKLPDAEHKAELFTKGLQAILANGTYERILASHNLPASLADPARNQLAGYCTPVP